MKKVKLALVAMAGIFCFVCGCKEEAVAKNSFIDPRDGKTYKTVRIGYQTWMAKNLNYNASGSECYKNKTRYCYKYGRLYNGWTASGVCPSGWHLPNDMEWLELADFVGSDGKKLKAKSGWKKDGNGTDEFGFSALPGGSGYPGDRDHFDSVGYIGYWWTASERNINHAHYYSISVDNDKVKNNNLYSVRCVQN